MTPEPFDSRVGAWAVAAACLAIVAVAALSNDLLPIGVSLIAACLALAHAVTVEARHRAGRGPAREICPDPYDWSTEEAQHLTAEVESAYRRPRRRSRTDPPRSAP